MTKEQLKELKLLTLDIMLAPLWILALPYLYGNKLWCKVAGETAPEHRKRPDLQ